MKNTYKNELIKLFSKKKYIVLLIIACLICVGRISFNFLITKLSHTEIISTNIVMEMLPFFAEIFVPLIVFMAICDLVSSEFFDLTIKAVLLRPVNRVKIITAKILAAFSMGVLFYIIVFISCTLLQAIFGKLTIAYMFKCLLSYVIDLIPLLALTLLASLINVISKTPTLSMFITIVAYAIMKYCNYFFPAVNTVIFTSYLQWHKLWIGEIIPFSALIIKIAILLSSGVLLYVGNILLFEKKEF